MVPSILKSKTKKQSFLGGRNDTHAKIVIRITHVIRSNVRHNVAHDHFSEPGLIAAT